MTEARTTNMPSRRAVTKAAAWSAPVIAAAVAAPMAAASQGGGGGNRLAWNPPQPFDTGTGTFNQTGDNKLEIQIFSKSKSLGVGQTFTVSVSKQTASFNQASFGAGGVYTGTGYTLTYIDASTVKVTSLVAKTAQDYLDVVFPAGMITMTPGSQLNAVADTNGWANSSQMNYA